MRIVVVDDEPRFRQMLTEWLTRQGYEVQPLKNESEILNLLDNGHYDVVILDLMMPKANGLTLLSEIRRLHPETSVIIMSAAVDLRVAIEATKAGAEACLEKPVDFGLLQKELRRLRPVPEQIPGDPGTAQRSQSSTL